MDEYYEQKPMKKKKGCRSFGCAFIIFLLIILAVIAVVAALLLYWDYSKWEESFVAMSADQTYTDFRLDKYGDIREQIDNKVELFTVSQQQVDFIELTPEEVTVLLHDSMKDSLPEDLAITAISIDSLDEEWNVYVQLELKGVTLPWVKAEIMQEDFETAEIFIKDIFVGPYNIELVGGGVIIDEINDGYRNALIFVNENGISDRKLENISLHEDSLILKGRDLN